MPHSSVSLRWSRIFSPVVILTILFVNLLATVQSAQAASMTITVNASVACSAADTPINHVQGSGDVSPLASQRVTVQGVVVGDYEGAAPNLRGFYLQEIAQIDSDPLTSEGIFVFNGNNNSVSLGKVVQVTGTAGENQGQTQISGSLTIESCGTTATVAPVDVQMPFPSADYLERYEGMLVRFPQALYVTEHFQLGRFGQVVMSSGGRLQQPTNVVAPGAEAQALQAANNLNRIIVDDELNNQNPDPIKFGRGGQPLSASNTLRGGDSLTNLVGVMTFTWAGHSASGNAYRVRPINDLSDLDGDVVPNFQPANPRTSTPGSFNGDVKVASFNVLNYFNGNGQGGGFPTPRGADSPAEFVRQRDKIISAITALDADVIGLMEIENDAAPNSAIEDLVSGLNTAAGAEIYAFIDTGVIGTDQIRVALIYKPAIVTPAGDYAILDSTVDPRFIDTKNRPALAQTFEQADLGTRFTVVVNHLKSKGSNCNDVGDFDTRDGQGNCNLTRKKAAQALVDWLATDPTGSSDPDFLIIGDLNSYAKEDPITAIKNAGYTNLIGRFVSASAYSYAFNGQWGYLDHALASESLTEQVTGLTEWHINADEPTVLDYNTNFKSAGQQSSLYAPDAYRSSDHDPILIGLDLKYHFSGFFQPVHNDKLNIAKAGSGVPVRFSLGGDVGLNIFAAGFPKSQEIACEATASVAGSDETVNAGASSLSYDASTDQYTYVWKTEKSWAGKCRQLIVKLNDGTEHQANFRFTK
jgi:predicted extracellular nuclease